MPGFNNNYYNPGLNYGYSVPPVQAVPQQRYVSPVNPFEPQYVTGIEGANAFQLPPGVSQMILWDTDMDCFYIKKLDEMGRPRVVAWKDFSDHVISQPQQQGQAHDNSQDSVDFSVYPTKKDLEEMLEKYDMTKYLTKADFEDALKHLYVGERGRIVHNELDS